MIIFVLLLSSLIYFYLPPSISGEKKLFYPEVTAQECDDDDQKAAKMLMERYLSHYTGKEIPKSSRIKEYKIKSVKVMDMEDDVSTPYKDLYFMADYDIRTYRASVWYAGNGETGKNGWINDKCACIIFRKENDVYRIESIGTGF